MGGHGTAIGAGGGQDMEREPARDTHHIYPLDMEEGLDTSSNGMEDNGVRNRNKNRHGCMCVYE